MIAIIDCGIGNLQSVYNGFLKIGADAVITSSQNVIADASKVVLPGVGAFQDYMRNLNEMNLIDPILKSINGGKPFLGICLGLQVLFEESEEFGEHKGLALIKGKVVRFPATVMKEEQLKVPHIGWNSVKVDRKDRDRFSIQDGSYYYFVHSYVVKPEEEVVLTTTTYGVEFVSTIVKDNMLACQFHPEKSQDDGLQILKSFSNWN